MISTERDIEKGLPSSPDIERLILGSVMLDGALMDAMRATIEADDFNTTAHRRIWDAMCRVYDSGVVIDRVVTYHNLQSRNEHEAVGGLSYLADLDNGLPRVPSLDNYIEILKEKTTLRRIILMADGIMKRCQGGLEKANDIRLSLMQSAVTLQSSAAVFGPVSSKELIDRYGIQELLDPHVNEGIRVPWGRLNAALCGLRGGQMIVLGAFTGRGKSSLALQIATHVTRQSLSPFVVTTEMPSRQMFRRMINQMTGLDGDRVRHDALTTAERERQVEQAYWLHSHEVFFDERSHTVPAILASLRQAQSKAQIGLVIIDHLQHVQNTGRATTRAQEVGQSSRAFKIAAMDFNLPFLVLSQFHRKGDDARDAGIHDLKESGDIENDADVVLILNGPELDGSSISPMRLKVAKQREGPAGFEIPLNFHLSSTRFTSED